MQIRKLSISSTRKVPHPQADFASISAHVGFEAELGDDDNAAVAAKKLQTQADNLVEQHLETIAERLRQRSAAAKPQQATEEKAAALAAKHGGRHG